MEFTWDYKINNFMFDNFNIDSVQKCLLVVFIVFCLAYLSHIMKILHTVVEYHYNTKWISRSINGDDDGRINASERVPLLQSLRIPSSNSYLKKQKLKKHAIQSLLYFVNLIVGYFLMLIVMNFYAGHFIATVLGFTFGYYLLNLKTPSDFKSVVANNNHCCNTNGTTSAENSSRNINYDEIS